MKPKERLLNRIEKAVNTGLLKELHNELGSEFSSVMNAAFLLLKRDYFLKQFKLSLMGETLLHGLIEQGAIDTNTLTWWNKGIEFLKPDFRKIFPVVALYGILVFFWDQGYFTQDVKKSHLINIAHEVFGVQPAQETMKNARGNRSATNLLKKMGYIK